MHLAYPATSLQALHSNTLKQIIQIQHNRIKKTQLAGGNQLAIDKNPHVINCWFLRLRMKSYDIIVINQLALVVQNMDNIIHRMVG